MCRVPTQNTRLIKFHRCTENTSSSTTATIDSPDNFSQSDAAAHSIAAADMVTVFVALCNALMCVRLLVATVTAMSSGAGQSQRNVRLYLKPLLLCRCYFASIEHRADILYYCRLYTSSQLLHFKYLIIIRTHFARRHRCRLSSRWSPSLVCPLNTCIISYCLRNQPRTLTAQPGTKTHSV